ncbi:MAG TPA: Rne/Rng family ribonuclease, partial [Cellulomonas sp.]
MTLDTTPEPAASTTPTTGDGGADAPTKPARRSRRATSAPKTAAEAPAVEALDAVGEPAAVQAAPADEAPTRPARRTRKKAAPAATLDEAVAAEVTVAATPAPAAAEVTDEAPTKPARRRATRSTAAAAPAGTEAAPAPVAEVVPASAPAAEQAATDPVPAAAPKRRRATRATASAAAPVAPAAPVVEAAAPVTPVVEPSAPAQVAEEPAASAAPARRSRRVTRPAAPALNPFAVPAPVEDLVHEVEEDEVEEDEEEVAETTAPVATAPAAGRLDVLAELGATQPAQPAKATSPARRQERGPQAPTGDQGRGSARLATTALLFQAPETRPRRRRASAPSGSPEAISAAAHAAEVEAAAAAEQEAAAPAVEQEQAPSTSSRRSRGRRGSRGGRAAEQDAVLAEQVAAVEDVEEIDAAATVGDATDAADATVEVEVTDESVEDGADDQDGDERDEDEGSSSPRRRRRRGGRGRRSRTGGEDVAGDEADAPEPAEAAGDDADESDEGDDRSDEDATGEQEEGGSSRRRRRRRRSGRGGDGDAEPAAPSRSRSSSRSSDEPTALRGSTRLEAKRQRRREGRDAGRRRQIITEAEFLARREAVERSMVVREAAGLTQIAVLEDGVLVEHYVSRQAAVSMAGNVYLGRVQNVLPSMEAAFVDVGKGRNTVLYAGEVNWDAAGVEGGQPRRIEQALKSGDPVLVQVTKDPIGHKGARLTSQITLAGRYLVYVPGGGMTGISRKLPENERARLKKILREVVPDSAGVIVRTAAEGASEEELRADIARLQGQWEAIEKKSRSASAPALLQGEPDMAIRVVRDIFNDDFSSLVVQGDEAWDTISGYIGELAPDLAEKVTRWTGQGDVFSAHRVDEQLAKGMDRKVYLPSGGSLVIDRTEAMTVIDVNTGKFTGVGGTLEETVTRNNIEAAEEIVRQLRLRDIGGIIVIDFIDMVLESNRDLVL